MEPHLPEIEIFVVLKWTVVVMMAAGLAQYSSLWVKRRFYGGEKHDRRGDLQQTRGWIERFLTVQKEYVDATLKVADNMQKILVALENNGKTIKAFTRSAECKYNHGDRNDRADDR